jgi:hypothetical protein
MAVTYKKAGKRDERLAVRLPKRTKFALERYAVRHDVSASSVINELVMQFLLDPDQGMMITLENGEQSFFGEACWDPLLPDSFLKIAVLAPEFLTEAEHIRWKVISEDTQYFGEDGRPDIKKIRDDWRKINDRENELLSIHS